MSETLTRVAVAAVGIPIAVAAIFFGGWILAALLATIAALAAGEMFRMAERKGPRPLRSFGSAAAAAAVLIAASRPGLGFANPAFGWLLVVLLVGAAALSIWTRGTEGEPLLSVSVTVFGALYTGLLLCTALFLRHLPGNAGAWHGTALLFVPVLLTWTSDTAAYFSGRAFGRRKLIPRVSPGKTVEGAAGALLGTIAVSVAYTYLLARFPTYRIGMGEAVLLGAGMSIAAQLGDLAESLLKRDAGVKDSGTLLPGHGGALDRFDSLLFTLPLAYAFLRYVVGAGA
ncbi:MAG: phosphatidate cytidylyltransferase [Gemmatimonadota bacterium]|nr:phosphatidate cytidylyltransferase [Gemmatimonadota bacterium]